MGVMHWNYKRNCDGSGRQCDAEQSNSFLIAGPMLWWWMWWMQLVYNLLLSSVFSVQLKAVRRDSLWCILLLNDDQDAHADCVDIWYFHSTDKGTTWTYDSCWLLCRRAELCQCVSNQFVKMKMWWKQEDEDKKMSKHRPALLQLLNVFTRQSLALSAVWCWAGSVQWLCRIAWSAET